MRYIRQSLLVSFLLTALLLLIVYPSLWNSVEIASVFVQVSDQQDTYVLSFTSDFPAPNVIVSSQSLPGNVRSETLSISSNGRWVFVRDLPSNNVPFPLLYTHVGESFTHPPLYSYRESLNADGNYLFYISVDATGQWEAYNFLNLAGGQHIELLVAPLSIPGSLAGITEAAVPVVGWTIGDNPLIFTAQKAVPVDYDGTGFYQVDLSGIDFTKSGSYAFPERTEIVTLDPEIGAGFLSPDRKYLAYLQYASEDQLSSDPDTPPTVNILELATGSIHTIVADAGEILSNVKWSANAEKLIYIKRTGQGSSFEVFTYDLISQQSEMIPLSLAGDVSEYRSLNAVICENTLFYTAHDPQHFGSTALYSVNLESLQNNQQLFVADSITIISCAPSSSWNPGRVSTCVPFCTPVPRTALGEVPDILALNLVGGDAANGQALYTQFSCKGCHEMTAIAPPLNGVYERVQKERLTEPLNRGETPEQYLAQSILQPNTYLVPGYFADIHPKDYEERMTLDELRDLIAYLSTQP